ncbi:MAG: hypothetical protein ACI92S_004875, partial [Planctomycetaceae bacterium]
MQSASKGNEPDSTTGSMQKLKPRKRRNYTERTKPVP